MSLIGLKKLQLSICQVFRLHCFTRRFIKHTLQRIRLNSLIFEHRGNQVALGYRVKLKVRVERSAVLIH